MPRNLFAALVAALSVLTFSLPLQAQTDPASPAAQGQAAQAVPTESLRHKIAVLEEQSKAAYNDGKWVRWYSANMKLHQLVPYEPEYLINVVRACALIDRKSTAYNYMYELQQQGFSYDFNTLEDTEAIRDTEAYEYINKLLVDAGAAGGEAEAAFTLPGNPSDYSALAWDPSRGRFLAGTLRDGVLLSVSPEGEATELLRADGENGIWSITGLEVDAANNRLWLSSSPTPAFHGYSEAEMGHGALFELDLETLDVVGQYFLPIDGLPHMLGGLVVTSDGTVFVIDRTLPFLFRKVPGSKRLEPFFADPNMFSFVDIAADPISGRIYVSDIVKGVLVIDAAAQQVTLLGGQDKMNLGGIRGLEYLDGSLYVVQGGFSPQRIVKLQLDPTGTLVENVTPMAIAQEEFDNPALGSIRDGSIYYVANSGLDSDAGAIVMNTPLDAGVVVAPPDLSGFEDALRNMQK